jgi:hypothetical protein
MDSPRASKTLVSRASFPAPALDGRARVRMSYGMEWVSDSRGYGWRLIYFPYGANDEDKAAVSVYLEVNPASSVSVPFVPFAACAADPGLGGVAADGLGQRTSGCGVWPAVAKTVSL